MRKYIIASTEQTVISCHTMKCYYSIHLCIFIITLNFGGNSRDVNGATENASTENESTGGWNMQVRICKGGKCKYGKHKYESATVENVSRPTAT